MNRLLREPLVHFLLIGALMFAIYAWNRVNKSEPARDQIVVSAGRIEQLNAIFADYDFICLPATPTPAWPLGESLDDPVAMYLSDIYTVAANMAGIPAISLPSGTHASTGLPLGMQLMAPAFKEADLLSFANQIL